jgi:hypothetical protein
MGNKRSISTINSMGALIERGWKIPGKFCKKTSAIWVQLHVYYGKF